MAVSNSVVLPAQPSTGVLDYIPLGGNGFSAPFAAWSLEAMTVTGDVSGGAASIGISMDMRYCSLVAFVTVAVLQTSAADADLRIQLTGSNTTDQGENVIMPSISATVASRTAGTVWRPTPQILPGGQSDAANLPRISARSLNVSTDVFEISCLIYLFNIRVREITPMGPLLWARGSAS